MKSHVESYGRTLKSAMLLALLFFAGLSGLLAQGWTSQTSGTTSNLNRVDFWNSTQGYAVGENGRVLSTTDGGATWNLFTSSPVQFFYGVSARSATQATVSGGNGTILVTTNGGTSWTAQTSGTSVFLYDCEFADANTGWVVGGSGVIRKTTDGGTTWNPQTSGTGNTLLGCFFLDTQTGWAVGAGGTIRATTNGGSTWNVQTSGLTGNLTNVFFTNATNGYAVGDGGKIVTTTDGGANWTQLTSGTNLNLLDVAFTSSTNGWVTRSNGQILRTTDAGQTWFASSVGSNTNGLDGIHFQSPNLGWVVGNSGTIYKFECTTTTFTDVQQSCGPFIWIDGNTYSSNNNTATHTISNALGCDSVVTLDLTIVQVDTSVTNAGQTLTSNQIGATYQWVVCDSAFTPVPNATLQSFTPLTPGDYAVQVTFNGCTSQSECHTVLPIGIEDELSANLIRVSPNPAVGSVAVELGAASEVTLMDAAGRVVMRRQMAQGKQALELTGIPSGLYFVRAQSGDFYKTVRLAVQ